MSIFPVPSKSVWLVNTHLFTSGPLLTHVLIFMHSQPAQACSSNWTPPKQVSMSLSFLLLSRRNCFMPIQPSIDLHLIRSNPARRTDDNGDVICRPFSRSLVIEPNEPLNLLGCPGYNMSSNKWDESSVISKSVVAIQSIRFTRLVSKIQHTVFYFQLTISLSSFLQPFPL